MIFFTVFSDCDCQTVNVISNRGIQGIYQKIAWDVNGRTSWTSSNGKAVWFHQTYEGWFFGPTLRSQIEGYTLLLIFRKFSSLPAVIWVSPFIKFQENFQPPLLLKPPRLLNFLQLMIFLSFFLTYVYTLHLVSEWLKNYSNRYIIMIMMGYLYLFKSYTFWTWCTTKSCPAIG